MTVETGIETMRLVRSQEVPLLQAHVSLLRHEPTGARWLHLACADSENHLVVAIPTQADDDTGKPHILEHCTFRAASRHYGDRASLGPRAHLGSGGGAWTGPDFTQYHLASRDHAGFLQLLDHKLDCLFEPVIDLEVFEGEACRLEFDVPDDPSTRLRWRGNVFNEQKGIVGVGLVHAWEALCPALFPGSHYAVNNGGDPRVIPELSYEDLLEFFDRHYHPGAAHIVTWGDLPLAELMAAMAAALDRVPPRAMRPMTFIPPRRSGPVTTRVPLPVTEDGAAAGGIVLLAWATCDWSDPYRVLLHDLVEDLLIGSPAARLSAALAESGLGRGPAETLTHYGWRYREHVLATGLTGVDPQRAREVETVALGSLRGLVETGIPETDIDAALHRLELRRRNLSSPSGASPVHMIITGILPPWVAGHDPLRLLDLETDLARLRQERGDGATPVEDFIREMLVDNPGRVLVVMEPAPGAGEYFEEEERARLAAIGADLGDEGRARIVAGAARYRAYFDARLQSVPRLPTPGELDSRVEAIPHRRARVADVAVETFVTQTRGISHIDLHLDLGDLPDHLVDDLGLFGDLLARTATADHDAETMATRIGATTGGITSDVHVLIDATGDTWAPRLRLGGLGLERRQAELCSLLGELLAGARFDVVGVRAAVVAAVARQEQQVFVRAEEHAQGLAASSVRRSAAFVERVSGLSQLDHLRRLAEGGDDAIGALVGQLEVIRAHVAHRGRIEVCAVVSSAGAADALEPHLAELLARLPSGLRPRRWAAETGPEASAQVTVRPWALANAFNCEAVRLPGPAHEDAPAVAVALAHASRTHIGPEVVRRGTAYHAHGLPYLDSGLGLMWSVRDPNLVSTFGAFAEGIRLLVDRPIDEDDLALDRLSIWQVLDPPGMPEERAKRAWTANRRGVTPDVLLRQREAALRVTAAQVRDAAERWLAGPRARASLAPSSMLAEAQAAGIEMRRLPAV